MRYPIYKALLRLLLLEALHPLFLSVAAYFTLGEFNLSTDLGRLYGACKLMHVAYLMAALDKLGLKIRAPFFTVGLSALVAALCPFFMFWLSGQFYRELPLDDILYAMQRMSWCYDLSWFIAAVILFVGLTHAIGGQGNGRRTEISDDFRGPWLAEVNTNGSQMTSPGSGIDVTGRIQGDTSI
ncbi:hypothetical protein EXE55_07030 [Burkholderia glumae]|uniref:hypothetical protein n=1 Tax=Burkholderia glumae TaxID=337 RepID=UPI001373FDA3|nr:hypothetical protein [Burkholderia glumae]QHP90703.1 hypothetical protein EXE55_07030 [Burkholderia glumae]